MDNARFRRVRLCYVVAERSAPTNTRSVLKFISCSEPNSCFQKKTKRKRVTGKRCAQQSACREGKRIQRIILESQAHKPKPPDNRARNRRRAAKPNLRNGCSFRNTHRGVSDRQTSSRRPPDPRCPPRRRARALTLFTAATDNADRGRHQRRRDGHRRGRPPRNRKDGRNTHVALLREPEKRRGAATDRHAPR